MEKRENQGLEGFEMLGWRVWTRCYLWAGGVAQVVMCLTKKAQSPEFKHPNYYRKKRKKKKMLLVRMVHVIIGWPGAGTQSQPPGLPVPPPIGSPPWFLAKCLRSFPCLYFPRCLHKGRSLNAIHNQLNVCWVSVGCQWFRSNFQNT
jgi:hypothetical protein